MNENVHVHSLSVFQCLSLLIEKGFNDVVVYENELKNLVKLHPSLKGSDIKKILDIIIKYLLETLEKHLSPTLDSAITTFFERICCVFDEDNKQLNDVEPMNDEKEEHLIEKSSEKDIET